MSGAERFRTLKENHLAVGRELFAEAVAPLDFLALAVVNRSLCYAAAFTYLIEAKNLIAAAPFIRLQLDSALRFYACSLVDTPHELTLSVMAGKSIRNQTDRHGNKLTDRFLVESLIADKRLPFQWEWIKTVYAKTSGHIHLSEEHVFNALRLKDKLGFEGKISEFDSYVSAATYEEAIAAFEASTDVALALVTFWAQQKNAMERRAADGHDIDGDEACEE